jgi:hypothetical protein
VQAVSSNRRTFVEGDAVVESIVSGAESGHPTIDIGSGADRMHPDFGPHVIIVHSSMPTAVINELIAPQTSQPFRQVFFLPGTYGTAAGQDDPGTAADIILAAVAEGTAFAGLGSSPTATEINGALYVNPSGFASLATFYRSLTNLSINPIQPGVRPRTLNWVTSQTSPFRRVNLQGDLDLEGQPPASPAFGSHFANTRIAGDVTAGNGRNTAGKPGQFSQGMYYVRNSELGGQWRGFGGMFVFSGVEGAPKGDFGPATAHSRSGDRVVLDATPLTREAPFMFVTDDGFAVFVPTAVNQARGVNWSVGADTGETLPIDEFHIARPTETAAQMNAQLRRGKHLILTPGRYLLDEPLRIDRPGTVVLGLGFATLVPVAGTAAVLVGDVPGVILSAFKIEAGIVHSDVLLQIGAPGTKSGSASDPTTLTDIHVGVPNPGRATTSTIINQDHVLIDGSWMKRADGGWTTARADHGLIVNGDHVSVSGMWLEHYQRTQILWNGNHGRAVFLQNEPPYDPPQQAAWMNGEKEGYPFLKIADDVTSFRADGVHTWARFSAGSATNTCYLSSAIETPVSDDVTFNATLAAVISYPNSRGGFRHIFNDLGPAVDATPYHLTSAYPQSDIFGISVVARIASFPPPRSAVEVR